jgi:hypothetical protein
MATDVLLLDEGVSILGDKQILISADTSIEIGKSDRLHLGADVIYMYSAVGINTLTPEAPLHVDGKEIYSTGSEAGFAFADRDTAHFSGRWVWYAESGAARLYADGAGDLLTVLSNGQVAMNQVNVTTVQLDILRGKFFDNSLIIDANNVYLELVNHQGRGLLFQLDPKTHHLTIAANKTFPGVAIGCDVTIEGNLNSTGKITQSSSRTLKKDVRALSTEEAAETLSCLEPVKFAYMADEEATPHAGFIAEDAPQLVATPDRTGVAPLDIVAVLTRVVKDQQKAIAHLKERLEALSMNRDGSVRV